jgi:predicted RNase H-like nuclease (RuvC/YqgF family)
MNRVNVILLCLTTLAIFYIIDKKPEIDIKKYETQINILQQKITMLESVNDSLTLESKELEKEIAAYDVKIDNLNRNINVIKKETKAQLDAIDYFGDDMLEQFFAERYKDRLFENDSIK